MREAPSRVTHLNIDGWNSWRTAGRDIVLTGSIPSELGGLAKLQRLTLSRNELTGTIPPELGNLAELTGLQLYSNDLTGGIPPELGYLSNLGQLELNHSQLSGAIPVELGQLSSLYALQLQNNRLTGSIPAALGDLTDLSHLKLAGNTGLTGCIPSALRSVSLNDLSSTGLSYCTTTTTYALTTSAGANGRISPLPGAHSYFDGASVTVTATPDDGYRVASWGGDCSGTATTCVLTMDTDKTASVTFELVSTTNYTLTTSAGANGSIDPAAGMHSYVDGTSVTVTATPDSGYRVESWGGGCSGTATTCVLTMDANKTASVTFELVTYTLTTSAGANGSIDLAAGTHTYNGGAGVTVTATPDSGYRVESWGGDCSGTATTCVLTMDADRTASVTFEQGQAYTLTTSTGANGSIDPAAGTHSYSDGVSVTVTATPDSGYGVESWGGGCSGTATTCVLTMDADKTASVTFELVTYTLTTSAGANGSIDPAAGAHTYNDGASVTVTATPDSGYGVESWGGDCSGTATTCVLTMDANRTASVTFEQGQAYTLTTSTGANGSIDPAAGTHSYSDDAIVTVTATPDSGYGVESWGGDCSGTATTCVLTMDANRTASVTFQPTAPDLIVVSDGAHDALLLEWTGGPANATKWQYRQRRWANLRPLTWEAWTGIPNSDASTRSYRLTSLSPLHAYDFQVRSLTGTATGAESGVATGITHVQGQSPALYADQIVEGDGRTTWYFAGEFTIVIPSGVRLVVGPVFFPVCSAEVSPCDIGMSVRHIESGSILWLTIRGEEMDRELVAGVVTSTRDSRATGSSPGTLFDQIVNSITSVPR